MLTILWYKTKARMWKIDNRVLCRSLHRCKAVVQSTLLWMKTYSQKNWFHVLPAKFSFMMTKSLI